MLYDNLSYSKIVSSFEQGGVIQKFEYSEYNNNGVYFFVKRDISFEIEGLEKGKYFDIITPFDYGGYFFTCKEIIPSFFEAFTQYCKEENIVSEFIRFCPTYDFDYEIISRYIDLRKVNDLVYIDLNVDFWDAYSRGRKSNIKRVQRYSYRIENVRTEDFYKLYEQTMKRNKAHPYFYFDVNSLEKLVNEKFARIFGLYIDKELISSLMLLDEEEVSYYFLGASSDDLLSMNANALLFHEVALLLKNEGKRKFFLGGGREGVYDFKRRFSKKTLPYFIGKKIHDKETYDYLVDLTKNQKNDFFPKYREKII